MSSKREIAELIRQIAREDSIGANSMLCKVTDVGDYTCVVQELLSGDEIPNVRLSAGINPEEGIVALPAKDSIVIVSQLSNTDRYVSMFSKITGFVITIEDMQFQITKDGIKLNKGQANSYLIDINKIVSELNEIRSDINSLKQAITTWVPVIQDGGAAFKLAATSWAGQILTPPVQVNDIKDEKVQH